MKILIYFLILVLLYSCSNISNCEKQKIYNPNNGETIYLKYCLYNSGHSETFISLDSIYKDLDDTLNDYISTFDDSAYLYKILNDTLYIYCYDRFQYPKNSNLFKTNIKILEIGITEWDKLEKDYKKLGLKAFPSCHFKEDTIKVDN